MRTPRSAGSPVAVRAIAAGFLALMAASLFWLAASSRLAAVGVQMDWLREHRMVLLQERSEALARYAESTDPNAMEQRAARLGLRPADPEDTVALPGPHLGRSGEAALDRVLSARRNAVSTHGASPDAAQSGGQQGVGAELAAVAAELRDEGE